MRLENISYLVAFWWAACGFIPEHLAEFQNRGQKWEWTDKNLHALSFTLWKASGGDSSRHLLSAIPEDLRVAVAGWDAQQQKGGPKFDFHICDWIERTWQQLQPPGEIFLTKRAFLGTTNDLGDEETQSSVVVKFAFVERLQLLRECREADMRYYEYVDGCDITHMGVPLEKLPGIVEQKLEIQ
jgi:hypothetical protein